MVWWIRGKGQKALLALAFVCVLWHSVHDNNATFRSMVMGDHAVSEKSSSVIGESSTQTRADPPSAAVVPTDATLLLPKYIFGVSTGHAGSTTVNKVLGSNCGHAQVKESFEKPRRPFEKNDQFDAGGAGSSEQDPCELVRTDLIPAIKESRGNASSFVDVGHFHNRGPVRVSILVCVAHIIIMRSSS